MTPIHLWRKQLILDPEDEPKRVMITRINGYAAVKIDGKDVYLHRILLEAPKGITVDHINRNVLDNRKENLRLATQQEQCHNTSIRSDNTSGAKGVSWDRTRNKWRAYINHNGRRIELGRYTTKEEAVKVYNEEAEKRFKEFAVLQQV